MKVIVTILRAFPPAMLFLLAACGGEDAPADKTVATPNYGQTKAAVIGALKDADAKGLSLVGVQVNEYEVFIKCSSAERLYELTGKWPAVLGLELMYMIENPAYRDYFMKRAEEQAARGGIVAITWHARNPLRVCPRGEYYLCSQFPMSDKELARILDHGTPEHKLWEKDVDAVADVLKEMQEKNVSPIFRPYHEMNGGWFWWGQKKRYTDLWRLLRHRLIEHDGLDNLVWTWAPDKESVGAAAYYPGDAAVDLVGADIYTTDRSDVMFEAAKANVARLHSSGLFAFTEIGLLPTPEILKAVRPAYFLLWGGEFINKDWSGSPCDGCNRAEDVAAIFALDNVAALDDLAWPAGSDVRYDAALRTKPPSVSCPASLLGASADDGSHSDD